MQSNVSCDICYSQKSSTYIDLPDSPFDLVRCNNCGLVYLDPRPSKDEIGKYYEEYYTNKPPTLSHYRSKQLRLKRLLHTIHTKSFTTVSILNKVAFKILARFSYFLVKRQLPPIKSGRLLDVGCGNGQWIASIHASLPFWHVEGSEATQDAYTQAQSTGLKIHHGELETLDLFKQSYDAITFWHSLEHTYSPANAIQEAYRLLRVGGWIAIEVPNIASFEAWLTKGRWYHLSIPHHLYHFSETTLSNLLEKEGFRIISVKKLRGNVGLVGATYDKRLAPQIIRVAILRPFLKIFGRYSSWGIRIYAEKI